MFPDQPTKPTPEDWLSSWRELAAATTGIEKEDNRHDRILDLLDECDNAYLSGDWPTFQVVANQVKAMCK